MHARSIVPWAVAAAVWCGAWSPAGAQLPSPQLTSIYPAGARQGTSVEVSVAGADLDDAAALVFSHPGLKARPKRTPSPWFEGREDPVPGVFTVDVAQDVPPGIYDVQVLGRFGLSNPRAFAVGLLPETLKQGDPRTPDKAQPVALDSSVQGRIAAGANDWYKFTAKQGQRVFIEGLAQRIDSRADLTLVVCDAAGRQLARDRDSYGRDPFIDFTAPADGDYLVRAYDFLYAGSNEYVYRLTLSTGPRVEFAFPPVVTAGQDAAVTVYGRGLPGGKPAQAASADGPALERLDVKLPAAALVASAAPGSPVGAARSWGALVERVEPASLVPGATSGGVVLGLTELPVVAEPEAADAPDPVLTVPAEFVGRFWPRGDVDAVTLSAKRGETLWFEVISHRLGLPTDPQLIVQRETKGPDGQTVWADATEIDDDATNPGGAIFSTATFDPRGQFTVPADGNYRLVIRNLYGDAQAEPHFAYRLIVRRPTPHFRLAAVPRSPNADQNENRALGLSVRRGGRAMIDVLVQRQEGFDQPIQLAVEGLPEGVTAPEVVVGAGATTGVVVVTAREDAPAATVPLKIVGRAKQGDRQLAVTATPGAVVWPSTVQNRPSDSRATRQLVLAVLAGDVEPLVLDVAGPLEMSRAGKLQVPVKVTRRGTALKAPIAVTALGLPAGVKPQALSIAPNQSQGHLTLEIPAGAPLGPFGLVLRGQTKLGYSRDPRAAETQAAIKKDFDGLLARLNGELAAAKKQLAEAPADKKPEAQKRVADLEARVKQATDARAAAEKRAADAVNAAKPKDLNLGVASNPLTVTVTPAPVRVSLPTPAAPLALGSKLELPVQIERLYDYADTVELEAVIPGGVRGLKIAKTTVPAKQTAGKLVCEAAADATPGTHALTLRARVRFNGQTLQVDQPLPITVAPAKAAAQK